ncbi:DsbA family protein [Candidatus Collierbacteria bacterium]|nr:DsbA family protein [Candidatus Collierbacteria bacterium]
MINWKIIISMIGGTVLIIIGASLFLSKPVNNSSAAIDSQKLVLGATHVLGEENAPVTVVEFSDFQCPACRLAALTLDELMVKHEGKIRFIYRHFPLTSIHKNALAASIASEAADSQGKFWEYSRVLFDNQNTWEQLGSPQDLFINLARESGVPDLDKFKSEISKQLKKDLILADMSFGNQLGINATPTFFVNGKKVSASGLKLAVEEVLSKPQ